jgi:endonuclease YncB( thermonuclease family)
VSATVAALVALTIVSGPARVIDGDTVEVGGHKIRLKGIDAPERRHPGGPAATDAMRRIIGNEQLDCAVTGEVNHDRQVGYCFTQETLRDIGQVIIEQGYALACPRYDVRYVKYEQPAALAAQYRARYCVRSGKPHAF